MAAPRRRSVRAIVVGRRRRHVQRRQRHRCRCTDLFFSVPAIRRDDAIAALDILHLFHRNPLGQRAGEALEQRHDRERAAQYRKQRRDVVVPPFGGSI